MGSRKPMEQWIVNNRETVWETNLSQKQWTRVVWKKVELALLTIGLVSHVLCSLIGRNYSFHWCGLNSLSLFPFSSFFLFLHSLIFSLCFYCFPPWSDLFWSDLSTLIHWNSQNYDNLICILCIDCFLFNWPVVVNHSVLINKKALRHISGSKGIVFI